MSVVASSAKGFVYPHLLAMKKFRVYIIGVILE
jgi:hypothetical protein